MKNLDKTVWTSSKLHAVLKKLKTAQSLGNWCDRNLDFIGQGAYRKVYKINFLPNSKKGNKAKKITAVLKIITDEDYSYEDYSSIECNKREISLYEKTHSRAISQIFDYDKNETLWLVAEFVPNKITTNEFLEFCKYLSKRKRIPKRFKTLVRFLRKHRELDDIHQGNIRTRNNGEIVLVDYAQ